MYKIVLTCFEPFEIKSYQDEIEGVYTSFLEAENTMLKAVLDELDCLNESTGVSATSVFKADLDGEHSAIIRMWDGDDYWDVTYYDIVEIKE